MPGLQVGDLGGGALDAALAIMVALHHATRTGEGQHCDVSMVDGLISWTAVHASQLFATGVAPEPGNGILTGRYPCYRIYACADGFLAVGTLEPKFWHAFVEAIGVPEVAELGFAEGEEAKRTIATVETVLRTRTRVAVADALAGLDVCVEPVLELRRDVRASAGAQPRDATRRRRGSADRAGRVSHPPHGFAGNLSTRSARATVSTPTRCSPRRVTTPARSRRFARRARFGE